MRWVTHVARMGQMIFCQKTQKKRPSCRNNKNINIQEIQLNCCEVTNVDYDDDDDDDDKEEEEEEEEEEDDNMQQQ